MHSTVNGLNATELFALKIINFMLCEFHLNKKRSNIDKMQNKNNSPMSETSCLPPPSGNNLN